MESEPLDRSDTLVSFGPHFGGEAAEMLTGRLDELGLVTFDDYYVVEDPVPDWLQLAALDASDEAHLPSNSGHAGVTFRRTSEGWTARVRSAFPDDFRDAPPRWELTLHGLELPEVDAMRAAIGAVFRQGGDASFSLGGVGLLFRTSLPDLILGPGKVGFELRVESFSLRTAVVRFAVDQTCTDSFLEQLEALS